METTIKVHYYQQFDADLKAEVPGEGYGGWKTTVLPFDLSATGFVFMHAWNCGTPEQYPGQYRACEYLFRANKIAEKVFPPFLVALRAAGLKIYHVAGDDIGLSQYSGYSPIKKGNALAAIRASQNANYMTLNEFRRRNVFVGTHNENDCERAAPYRNFHHCALPIGEEPIFLCSDGLAEKCKADGVNHLIYSGFAINWCLAMSPCGMFDMGRLGFICSAVRDAVTAVENKESARTEAHKDEALWRTTLMWGFVFDSKDIITAVGDVKR